MSPITPQPVLKGAKALVVGIANDSSIAYGCARALHELGADRSRISVFQPVEQVGQFQFIRPKKGLDRKFLIQVSLAQAMESDIQIRRGRRVHHGQRIQTGIEVAT